MAKTTLTQVTLLIDRDAGTKIPVVVFDYEQPLLEEIYGEELVYEVEAKEVEVEDFDVQAAFDGLVSKYGSNTESDRARKLLYPKLRDLEKKLGVSTKAAKTSQAQTSTGGTIKELIERIGGMSDEELDKLEADEKAREKPRDGVFSAIDSERAKRKAQ
ncbi:MULTISPECIES: hypothetical protein [Xanthomonas]|uniref:Phage protein n=1 Tax=Xanthomonas dyei TaxID=743699 RepID=A0ABZ0D397_9XANT|nr:hypothetical protein [Xanthomonas dyei]WOB24751.1 hypothetical protein NYR99_13175 [Xanthomonas dyei]WOB52379.1 hypothetical protein NYR95_13180 [Xanthomonas dyei]